MKYSVKNIQQIISISIFSHPKLLTVPSELFYEGELEPKADPFVTHSMLNWALLPNKKVPLVFHGVVGKKVLVSVGLFSFYFVGSKLFIFLAKIEHTPRKLLHFVNRWDFFFTFDI